MESVRWKTGVVGHSPCLIEYKYGLENYKILNYQVLTLLKIIHKAR